eukprot:CAMPEP_0118641864 /NCGR_PEP_ID=MMETSP0785-20121206/5531_1 /TAXON_ID=91992 /ORGANISM="Bolidomonas pacifica, Strain CCMP 1866" /LENGTH=653 /DNA_ID=CAMNT_0006533381 /DNA_START=150 /DNA_END=2107 /DNA_ORIENTATION=-
MASRGSTGSRERRISRGNRASRQSRTSASFFSPQQEDDGEDGLFLPLPTSGTTTLMEMNHESNYAVSECKGTYRARYELVARKQQTKEDMRDEAQTKWHHAMATKRMAMWIRRRIRERMKLKPLEKTLTNLEPPQPISTWEGRRRYLCDRCLLPCPGADITCKYCNIVIHEACLTKAEFHKYMVNIHADESVNKTPPGRNVRISGYTAGRSNSPPLEMISKRNPYVCEFCAKDQDEDQQWFHEEQKRLWRAENEQYNALLIGRVLRGFLSRFRYRRYRKGVIKFQSMMRQYVDYRKFKIYRRTVKRPMIINVLGAQNMPSVNRDHATADPYVVVTVHDTYHRDQVLRFDTSVKRETLDCEWEPQNFLVPGISGNSTIVFTVLDEDEMRDQFLGQCAIPLGQGDLWLKGGKFDVDLGDLQYVIKNNNTQQADIAYEKVAPQGTLTIEIKPLCSLHSVCGPIEGPHSDLLSAMTKSNSATHNISKMTQKMNYWGVVANGELSMYRRFGDRHPKLVCSLENLSVSKVKTQGRVKVHSRKKKAPSPTRKGGKAEKKKKLMSYQDSKRKLMRQQSEQQCLKQFSLKNTDIASSNRLKYVFEVPSVKDCNNWFEVIEHWEKEFKILKRERSRSRSRGRSRSRAMSRARSRSRAGSASPT